MRLSIWDFRPALSECFERNGWGWCWRINGVFASPNPTRARARITRILCFLLSQVSQQEMKMSDVLLKMSLVLPKMSDVLLKTSRRFMQNELSFYGKQAVVWALQMDEM